MNTRLVLQESCEHGNYGRCRVDIRWRLLTKPCPGGSSREITVDYEAAKRQIDHEYDDDLPIGNVKLIVNAALGGGW